MFYEKLSAWSLEHKRLVLTIIGLLTLVSAFQLRLLFFDFQPSAMLQFSAEEEQFSEDFAERFHVTEDVVLFILSSPKDGEMLTPEGLALQHRVTGLVKDSGLAAEVRSFTSLPRYSGPSLPESQSRPSFLRRLGSALDGDWSLIPQPLIAHLPVSAADAARARLHFERSFVAKGQLISERGSTASVVLFLKPGLSEPARLAPKLQSLTELIEAELQNPKLAGTTLSSEGAIELHVGGLPHVRVETVRFLKHDQLTFWPLVGGVFFLLMLLYFRSIYQALLPLITVGLATLWITGAMATLGQEINVINNILPTLILVVGICDGVHLMLRINTLRAQGASPSEAAKRSMGELGFPCLLTTLTSAIGFVSLVTARSDVLKSFGWQVALGLMMAYVAIIFLIPIGSTYLKAKPKRTSDLPPNRGERLLERLTVGILKRPRAVLSFSAFAFAALLFLGWQVPIDARAVDTFREGHPIYETHHLIERELGGILPLEIQLSSAEGSLLKEPATLQKIAAFQRNLETKEGVLTTFSLLDLLAEAHLSRKGERINWRADPTLAPALHEDITLLSTFAPNQFAQFATQKGDALRVTARMADQGVKKTLTVIDEIKETANTHLNPNPEQSLITMRQTGTAYISAIGLSAFVKDLFFSLITATLVIFFVMILVFRSWRVGLISLLPNLLPLLITLSLMPLYGYELDTSSTLIFTISIGLAVDNTIHMVSRYLEVRDEMPDADAAILEATRTAGRAIIASNFFLMAGFASLYLSDFDPTRRVAVLTVTTIFGALIAALVLLPALIKVLPPEQRRSTPA